MHRSLLKRFPFFISFCLPVSSVPNFRPDTGGQKWSLIQVASSVALWGGAAAAFPSTLLRLPAALCGACTERGSSPPVFHKSAEQKAVPAFCAFPVREAQAARSLTGALSRGSWHLLSSVVAVSVSSHASRVRVPSAFLIPCPSPRPRRSGACTLCLPATLLAESQKVFD